MEGDLRLIRWDVLWVTAVEPCAVDVYHLTTTGQPRGLFVRRHCREAILNARGQREYGMRACSAFAWGWKAGIRPGLR